MPAYVYSQIKDPETGLEICVPQLFPYASSTGNILPEEIEGWVKTGAIPQQVYETHLHDLKRMVEIRERIKNGEEVLVSELPPPTCGLSDFMLKNKASLYGENVLIKIFSQINANDHDIVWLSFVKEAITCIASQGPLQIHILVAKKVLKNRFSIEDSRMIGLLAGELVDSCHTILKFPTFQHKAFNKNPVDIEDLNDHLKDNKKKILKLDAEFIDYLKTIGRNGKKLAEDVEEKSLELYRYYESINYSPEYRREVWALWAPSTNEQTTLALDYLAEVLWEDICIKLWNRETKGTPALVKPIIERIIPLTNPKKSNKFIESEGNITLYGQNGETLLMAPAVDINMITPFKKGVKELGTLTGHKMLRWQVNTGFERWAKGESDPRLIEIDGGYSKIADSIGCKHPSEIAKVKNILHAQAHGYFKFADGSHGNMIILNILSMYQNSEPSKIRIVLGDMLLPTYIHQIERSEKRFIPIGDLPPLDGASPDTFAAQAQLQLLVFCEFSNQSVRLLKEGSVILTDDWWIEKAIESGLKPDKIKSIIERWCQPDMFNCFLERQGNEYRLASYYERQQKFLEDQGQIRIKNSEKGKKSVEAKKMKK
jgi:hypothetical protein